MLLHFRVINPPGGKCSINLFEEELEPQNIIPINKCQEARMKSQVFCTVKNEEPESTKSVNNNERIVDRNESNGASTPPKETDIATEPLSGIFPCAPWSPMKVQQKRQSPFALRNNQSHIF